MRKLTALFAIFVTINTLFSAEYPDFKTIVQKQHEVQALEREYFARIWPEMIDASREMEYYDVRYYRIDIDLDFDFSNSSEPLTYPFRISLRR